MSAGEIVSIVAVGITLLGVFAKLIIVLNDLSASIKSLTKMIDNHETRLIAIEHERR